MVSNNLLSIITGECIEIMIFAGKIVSCEIISIFKPWKQQTQNHSTFSLIQGYSENLFLTIFKLFFVVFYGKFASAKTIRQIVQLI